MPGKQQNNGNESTNMFLFLIVLDPIPIAVSAVNIPNTVVDPTGVLHNAESSNNLQLNLP